LKTVGIFKLSYLVQELELKRQSFHESQLSQVCTALRGCFLMLIFFNESPHIVQKYLYTMFQFLIYLSNMKNFLPIHVLEQ